MSIIFGILGGLAAALRSVGSLIGTNALDDLAYMLEKPSQQYNDVKNRIDEKKVHLSGVKSGLSKAKKTVKKNDKAA